MNAHDLLTLLKPDWREGAALAGALLLLMLGIAFIRGKRRRRSTAHEREMTARKQKEREQLPPGQL